MSFLRIAVVVGSAATLVVACSGSPVTVDDGTDADASADGGATSDASSTDGGTVGNDGGTTGDGAAMNDGSSAIDGSTPDSGPGACPDESGKYTILATGLGCGELSITAPQCITQNQCAITFTSNGGNAKALNGDANLAMDGSFTGAAIKEGNTNRTGCVGTWDAVTSRLTVDCGGVSTSQSCRAVLTRTATNCN